MNLRVLLVLPFAILLLSSCAATLTQTGGGVRIAHSPLSHKCELVGDVSGDSGYFGSTSLSAATKNARINIKNAAAEMGANIVVLETNNQLGSRVVLVGQAYKCSE
jgi:hypothetical protein